MRWLVVTVRVGHHRRFTANHTLCVDWRRHRLFIKLSPDRAEAAAEIAGYARLTGAYPVPVLLGHHAFGRYTVLIYERYGTCRPDQGLLLDEITHADATEMREGLDNCLDRILRHYATVIQATFQQVPQERTVSKLYGERVERGGRLDSYYGPDRPLLVLPNGQPLRPSDLRHTVLVVNGREHRLDFPALVDWLRDAFSPRHRVWAALTQGDPTDFNIGSAPMWFDYDTGGLNALAGEFACFLWYQQLHGGWLVPTYNPRAFVDHPRNRHSRDANRPHVALGRDGRHGVTVTYRHRPSAARGHAISRYRRELTEPTAAGIGVTSILGWMRPYLVMRILGVYNLGDLTPSDAALSLAYLAEVLAPDTRMDDIFPACDTTLPATARAARP